METRLLGLGTILPWPWAPGFVSLGFERPHLCGSNAQSFPALKFRSGEIPESVPTWVCLQRTVRFRVYGVFSCLIGVGELISKKS